MLLAPFTMALPTDGELVQSLLESRCSLLITLLKITLVSLRQELSQCAPRDVVLQHTLFLSRVIRVCLPLSQLQMLWKKRVPSKIEVSAGDTGARRISITLPPSDAKPNRALTRIRVENLILTKHFLLPYPAQGISTATVSDPNFMNQLSSFCTDISAAASESVLSLKPQESQFWDPQCPKVDDSSASANSPQLGAQSQGSHCDQEHSGASYMSNALLLPSQLTSISTRFDGLVHENHCQANEVTMRLSKSCSTRLPRESQPCLCDLEPNTSSKCSIQTPYMSLGHTSPVETASDMDCYICQSLWTTEGESFNASQGIGAFQRRTYYRGKAIDERRNPCAPWVSNSLPTTPHSLSVNASVNSLDTLDSLHSHTSQVFTRSSHANKSHSRPQGYSNFRRVEYPESHGWSHSAHPGRFESSASGGVMNIEQLGAEAMNSPQREREREITSFVRLRDQIFEIGADGRIRRHHSQRRRENHCPEKIVVRDQRPEAC